MNPPAMYLPGTAAHEGFAHCHVCLKVARVDLERCPRCRTRLRLRVKNSLQWTLAFIITAIILLVPANTLPIMTTELLGGSTESTIVGGVVMLWEHGSYPVATVIFIASVMVPTGKIVALGYLCWRIGSGHQAGMRERATLYRIAELVGRWSMVDVFVVAVLVGLIQLGTVTAIHPGYAALAFAGVVITTMIAAERFDPRLIWDQLRQ